MWFGADVATEPSGEAGEEVCIAAGIGAAEIAPGTAQPPYARQDLASTTSRYILQYRLTSLGSTFTNTGVQSCPVRTA